VFLHLRRALEDCWKLIPFGSQLVRRPGFRQTPAEKGKYGHTRVNQAPPPPVVHVEVVLDDPALSELQVPAVVLRIPDGDHDPGWFAGLQDHDHVVGLRTLEVRLDELVGSPGRCIEDRHIPLQGAFLDQALELVGNVAEDLGSPGTAVGSVEEPNHAFRLLDMYDLCMEQSTDRVAGMKSCLRGNTTA
jgi:hypothetical protein